MSTPERYRKKPVVVEAAQWFANGDHPDDGVGDQVPDPQRTGATYTRIEGAVVRFFRHPDYPGDSIHGTLPDTRRPHCTARMHDHGWIDTIEGGHTVCPGDWIITGVQCERYPVEPRIFEKTYERAEEQADAHA